MSTSLLSALTSIAPVPVVAGAVLGVCSGCQTTVSASTVAASAPAGTSTGSRLRRRGALSASMRAARSRRSVSLSMCSLAVANSACACLARSGSDLIESRGGVRFHFQSSSLCRSASMARDKWVFTLPSEQPMTRAVSATSSPSSTRSMNASRWRRGSARTARDKSA